MEYRMRKIQEDPAMAREKERLKQLEYRRKKKEEQNHRTTTKKSKWLFEQVCNITGRRQYAVVVGYFLSYKSD